MADGRAAMCRPCKRSDDHSREPGAVDLRAPAAVSASKARNLAPPTGDSPSAAPAPPKRRGGVPSTITPELITEICGVLERGHTRRVAARMAGVLEDTLAKWIQRGEELRGEGKPGPTRDLFEAVLLAEGRGEYSLVELVKTASEIDPHNAKWLLERRYSTGLETWSRKEQVTLATGDKPLEVNVLRELLAKKLDAFDRSEPAAAPPVAPPPPAPDPGPAPPVPGGPS
jgi:hypothetical protein